MFNMARQLIDNINQLDETYHFNLIENDITHIKYQAGYFFQPHEDYLTLTSNIVEEFTLLICL